MVGFSRRRTPATVGQPRRAASQSQPPAIAAAGQVDTTPYLCACWSSASLCAGTRWPTTFRKSRHDRGLLIVFSPGCPR